MRQPRATPPRPREEAPAAPRAPRTFAADTITQTEDVFEAERGDLAPSDVTPEPRTHNRLWWRLLWGAGGLLVSLGLGLAAERLIRDLFARYEWLGWLGLAAAALLVVALVVLVFRETLALLRLRNLDTLRKRAEGAIADDSLDAAKTITGEFLSLYAGRADLARARADLESHREAMLDGAQLLHIAERTLFAPLDQKARALIAASARRVALVTAVSPRALIDIAFIVFESFRLARMLADLYGARPGVLGFLSLVRAILAHLAVTGGIVLTDGAIEQLVGHSMASRISSRLGEGVVNGLMTVRVGIAAIHVVRPMPFAARRPPRVADFAGELANVTANATHEKGRRQ